MGLDDEHPLAGEQAMSSRPLRSSPRQQQHSVMGWDTFDALHRAMGIHVPQGTAQGVLCWSGATSAAMLEVLLRIFKSGIVALGKFDALHVGHRALAVQAAAMGGTCVCMLSFAGMAQVLGWEKSRTASCSPPFCMLACLLLVTHPVPSKHHYPRPSSPPLSLRLPLVAPCDRKRALQLWQPYCHGQPICLPARLLPVTLSPAPLLSLPPTPRAPPGGALLPLVAPCDRKRVLQLWQPYCHGQPICMPACLLLVNLSLPSHIRLPLVAPCDRKRAPQLWQPFCKGQPICVPACLLPRVLQLWQPFCEGQPICEFFLDFARIRSLSPEDFIVLLAEQLRVKGIVAGSNYRFGFRAAGTASDLVALGAKHGLHVMIVDTVTDAHAHMHTDVLADSDVPAPAAAGSAAGAAAAGAAGAASAVAGDSATAATAAASEAEEEETHVSSTRVRQQLCEGNVEAVAVLIARRHRVLVSLSASSLSFSSCGSRSSGGSKSSGGGWQMTVERQDLLNLAPGEGRYKCRVLAHDDDEEGEDGCRHREVLVGEGEVEVGEVHLRVTVQRAVLPVGQLHRWTCLMLEI
ncbi:unnamed protein product [Closterium sp. NIES-65]|nr:unnamed protein product [Closterium sp. NIES-65]